MPSDRIRLDPAPTAVDGRLASLLDHLAAVTGPDEVAVVADADRSIVWVSGTVVDVLGWTPEQFRRVCTHLIHPADQSLAEATSSLVREVPGAHRAGEGRHLGRDGRWRWLRVTAVNLLPDLGVVVTRFLDVTDLRHAWEQAVAAATDELTGLASRAAVRAEIERRLADGDRTVAVLFCDLDGFKAVNDRRGHLAGDDLLAHVGRRLQGAVAPMHGVVGRWGGDEFVAVVDVASSTDGLRVGAALRAAASVPADAGGPVGASVGVALGRLGDDVEGLLWRADRAMYAIKRAGGGVASA